MRLPKEPTGRPEKDTTLGIEVIAYHLQEQWVQLEREEI